MTAQSQLNINEQCPKKKHGKKLTCADCRTGFSVPYTNAKGKTVRKCACKPVGEGCSAGTAANCCSGVCGEDGTCVNPTTPTQTCAAVGASCSGGAQCCSSICNVGGSDIGPVFGPNPGTANKCAFCLTGEATCNLNSLDLYCNGGCDPATNRCCSLAGETCTPTGSTASVPAQGSCCTDDDRCPVTGNVGTPNVCCTASGQFPPLGFCGTDGNTGQGCCTGQCNDMTGLCCAPAGTNPALSGGAPCTGTGPNASCCSGSCAAAGSCA